jgi:hypothetical protein
MRERCERYSEAAISLPWEQRDLAIYCGDAQICHCGVWSDSWDTAFAMARHIVEAHNATLSDVAPVQA